jgi:hypothetical protein
MIKGYLYNKTNDEIKQDIKKGAVVSVGIDLNSLLDTILLNEINSRNDSALTIALLKQEVLFLMDKLELPKGKE